MAQDKSRTKIYKWWALDKDEAHKGVFEVVNFLHSNQQDRQDRNLRCLQLYGNADLGGMSPYSYMRATIPSLPENRVKYNTIASMTDTACAKISKMKPKVTFLTSGGDFNVQEEAKKLDKYMLGWFYRNKLHTKHQEMFRDGLVMDVGALKHYIDYAKKTIVTERVLAPELYVDPADAIYGTPQHLYQAKIMHKDVAAELWPKMRGAILQSNGWIGNTASYSQDMSDYIVVIEAWRLPYGKKAGRHIICCEHGTMLDEDYKRDYFPFTFSKWARPIVGFWGQSLADRLTGNQLEINKMLRIIQKSFHLGSVFKVFLEYGSRVAKEHLNNEIGSIVYYTGQAPQFYVPKTVHEEFFRHLEWLIKSAYEEAGISQMSASSQKPAGLDSAVSMREYNDIETERFAITSQLYEETFLETARQYIDLSQEMSEEGIELEVVAESKRFIETIKWSDINLKNNEYILQMFPTSMLPHQPAGRLALVQELIQSGMIPPDFGLRLLDFPDLESYMSLKNASIDNLMETLYELLYKGKWISPEPFQDLAQGIKLFQSAYLKAKKDGAPEKRLELIRRWIATAQALSDSAGTGGGQPLPPEASGMPAAQVTPAPQSQQPAAPQAMLGSAPQ